MPDLPGARLLLGIPTASAAAAAAEERLLREFGPFINRLDDAARRWFACEAILNPAALGDIRRHLVRVEALLALPIECLGWDGVQLFRALSLPGPGRPPAGPGAWIEILTVRGAAGWVPSPWAEPLPLSPATLGRLTAAEPV